MKRVFIIIFLLVFTSTGLVFADDKVATSASNVDKSDITNKEIRYDLPYPGILPDHPFYTLKTIRDRVISLLINDPLKKAEFNLLTSDKRLNAASYLVKNKKYSLAVLTVSKSNNYFHDAIGELYKAKNFGKEIFDIELKMKTSLKKHDEVLFILEKEIDSKYKKEISAEHNRVKILENYLKGISGSR